MEISITHRGPNVLDTIMEEVGYDRNLPIETRECVRGIILDNNKIRVVYPKNEVLYGTPGGGIDDGEDQITALKRELLEEVGAKDIEIIDYLGCVKEFRKSVYTNKVYTPLMHYYLVQVNEYTTPQLIDYEEKLELTNESLDINQVIKHNKMILTESNNPFSPFYYFQTEVLKILKNHFNL